MFWVWSLWLWIGYDFPFFFDFFFIMAIVNNIFLSFFCDTIWSTRVDDPKIMIHPAFTCNQRHLVVICATLFWVIVRCVVAVFVFQKIVTCFLALWFWMSRSSTTRVYLRTDTVMILLAKIVFVKYGYIITQFYKKCLTIIFMNRFSVRFFPLNPKIFI